MASCAVLQLSRLNRASLRPEDGDGPHGTEADIRGHILVGGDYDDSDGAGYCILNCVKGSGVTDGRTT